MYGITPAGAGKTRRCCAHRPKSQDHPRRCGENRLNTSWYSSVRGSPPQVRGKLCCYARATRKDRITPAGAGKTAPPQRTRRNAWDHPRRCGENGLQIFKFIGRLGSPPQVRGKHFHANAAPWADGITPAGAGKTLRQLKKKSRVQGSPPQVRGKLGSHNNFRLCARITPAGAGKT